MKTGVFPWQAHFPASGKRIWVFHAYLCLEKRNQAPLSKCGMVDAKTNLLSCLSLLPAIVVRLPFYDGRSILFFQFLKISYTYMVYLGHIHLPPSSAPIFPNTSLFQIPFFFFCHDPLNPIGAAHLHVDVVSPTWSSGLPTHSR